MDALHFSLGLAIGAAGAAPAFALQQQPPATKDERPNIVIILADDMGFSDIGCYGGEVHTPNLDHMAARGVRFTQFYNCARCCPTRASLMTGLYPHAAGIGRMTEFDYGKPGYRGSLNDQCVTIAEAMRSAGYHTYMAGKWHVSRNFQPDGDKSAWPMQRGFDKFYGTLIAAGSYWDPITLTEGNDPVEPQGDYYYTEALGQKAVDYIRDAEGEPFFLYLAFSAPHWPLHARQEVIEQYHGRFAAGWDELRQQRYQRLIDLGIIDPHWALSPRDADVEAWDKTEYPDWQQTRMEAFAAAVDHIDRAVGRVVEELQQRGQLDNTVIFFLSDNGGESIEHFNGMIGDTGRPWAQMRYVPLYTRDGRPILAGDIPGKRLGDDTSYGGYGRPWANLSNTPFRYFKHYTHEGGISTPLIVQWPARLHAQGAFRRQIGHIIDLMPTCLDIAGSTYPDQLDGKPRKSLAGVSLLPAILDDQPMPQRMLFWEHIGHRAVRDGKWKLVSLPDAPWELYDMEADRTETRDLAAEQPQLVERLSKAYQQWADRNNVLPFDELKTPELSGKDTIMRSQEEIDEYYAALRRMGIEPPITNK